jgi:acyl-CoA hydrolase
MSGKKTIDSTQFLTNDRSNNVSSKPIVKISTNYQILNAEEVEDVVENHHEETETEEERIKKMSAEQYTAYLKEKNENPLTKTFKTIAKGIGALVTSPMNLFDSNGIIDSIRSEVLV